MSSVNTNMTIKALQYSDINIVGMHGWW